MVHSMLRFIEKSPTGFHAVKNAVELLEKEGAEAVVPDLMDFLNYSFYNNQYRVEFLGAKRSSKTTSVLAVDLIQKIRKPALDALRNSKRFDPPMPIEEIAEQTKPFLSIGNQYGEGWFLTGEMIELIKTGVPNIVCIQPFACLPNHVVGKGMAIISRSARRVVVWARSR